MYDPYAKLTDEEVKQFTELILAMIAARLAEKKTGRR